MGRNLARNIARHGHTVAVHNRTTAKMTDLIDEFGDEAATFGGCRRRVASRTSSPPSSSRARSSSWSRPATRPTRSSTSWCRCSTRATSSSTAATPTSPTPCAASRRWRRRACTSSAPASPAARSARSTGPSIMVGGSRRGLRAARPDHRVDRRPRRRRPRAAPTSAPDAAGHFVKMVHNGIEYADMQLIAESYDLLRIVVGPRARRDRRRLRELERRRPRVVPHRDDRRRAATTPTPRPASRSSTSSRDAAEQKGTGRWTVQSALDLGVPITGIAEATFARSLSGPHRAARGRPRGVLHLLRGRHRRRRPRHLRRRRPRRAVRLQGGRLRPGLRPDRRRRRGVRLGRRPRPRSPPSGAAAASSGPGSSTGSPRRTPTSPT